MKKETEKETTETSPIEEVLSVEPVIVSEIVSEPETKSEARIAFEKFIENYKKQNPKKYEEKKVALEAELNTL